MLESVKDKLRAGPWPRGKIIKRERLPNGYWKLKIHLIDGDVVNWFTSPLPCPPAGPPPKKRWKLVGVEPPVPYSGSVAVAMGANPKTNPKSKSVRVGALTKSKRTTHAGVLPKSSAFWKKR